MKKVFLLSGVLLFILGSVLVLGSYFLFNRFSLSDWTDFGRNAYGQWGGTWDFPYRPLELTEGDTISIQIRMNESRTLSFSISNTEKGQVYAKSATSNFFIVDYYVQTNDFYSFSIEPLSTGKALHAEYYIEVVRKVPNQLFLVIGVVVLLAGAVMTPIAFLYKNKIG